MLSDTGVDKGDMVPITIPIVYGSKALDQKLTSNTELTRSHKCQEHIAVYRAQHQLETITPPPCNKRENSASKDGNPPSNDAAPKDGNLPGSDAASKGGNSPGSNAAPKDGSPLGSDATPEDGNSLGSDAALEDGNTLGSDAAPEDGSPLESESAIRTRKPRSGSNKEKNNPKRRK